MSLPFPQSKNHLLSLVDNLTYTERFNYASRLGRDHKGKPALLALVNDLLKHPDPPVPEMEAEEGFTEILPAQRTSISKYYNEDQLALAIAVSAGMFEVIKARLYSPSVFFDHLVFTNYVRMKKEQMQVDAGKKAPVEYCASDDEVIKAILEAVPARARLLIQESIQAKRLSIITTVVPQLLALPNYPAKSVAHIIHACSSETVKNFLFENKFTDAGQVWNKLIKFHVMSVWELLEEDLQAHNPFERGVLYNTYENWAFKASKTVPRFLRNVTAMDKYLDLVLKYPVTTPSGPHGELPSAVPGKCEIGIPNLISFHNMQRFMTALPEKTTKVMLSTVWLHHTGLMKLSVPVMAQVFTLRMGYVNQYFKKVFETSPSEAKLHKHQPDYHFITEFSNSISASISFKIS